MECVIAKGTKRTSRTKEIFLKTAFSDVPFVVFVLYAFFGRN